MKTDRPINPGRRELLAAGAALGLASVVPVGWAAARERIVRAIPGRDETLPVIGMGSWGTFDVGRNERVRRQRLPVLAGLFENGGTLIDSSPMYGSSEENIGWCLGRLDGPPVFAATKVWIRGAAAGVEQMAASEKLWGTKRFDVMQIHNFMDWRTHLDTLRRWRDEGRIRYIGITTSHGRRNDDMERVIRDEKDIDFVQFTYNIADRNAEKRLLPLAADHGKATVINRPFRRKQLINAVQAAPLPEWAGEFDCETWPQFLLKYIASHPAVTCAIPATSRVDHMQENMQACHGRLPDAAMRKRMVTYFESI